MSSDSETDSIPTSKRRKVDSTSPLNGLYLDTINRDRLDFDFEHVCSVSSTNFNIYCCLSCGKYFQGKGQNSHAYFHALQYDHHVFMSLETQRIFVLPETYEVLENSLNDIKYVANPTYDKDQIAKLDLISGCKDLNGTVYVPGTESLIRFCGPK